MEIKYFGGNCIKITTKKSSVIIDDAVNTSNKSISTDKDIVIRTYLDKSSCKYFFLIDGPGEYEVSDVSVKGLPAQAHIDEKGSNSSTVYRLSYDDLKIGVVGHVHPDITEEQLEDLEAIDILFVPIGGNGYTLDGVGAQRIIRAVEPKIVIPTHFDDGKTKYEVPQQPLEMALKSLSMEASETVESLKIKNTDLSFSENTRLIVIEPK